MEQEESTRGGGAGKYYIESARAELAITRAITDTNPGSAPTVFDMVLKYLGAHKMCLYAWDDAEQKYKTVDIFGKDKVDIRLKHLNDEDERYFRYVNEYGFLQMDNINNLDTMDKKRFHMYLEDNVGSTMEILSQSEDKTCRVLICFDIYKPARTFQPHKIVFAIMVAKLISHALYSKIEA